MDPYLFEKKILAIRTLMKLENSGTSEIFAILFDAYKEDYIYFTDFEYNNAPEDVRAYVKEKDWIVDAETYYSYTSAFDEFKYSLNKLRDFLLITESGLLILPGMPGTNNTSELIEEIGWELFEKKVNEIVDHTIYEFALINLIIIFESYLNQAIIWIYKNNKSAQESLRVNLTYGEVLKNWDNLIEAILNTELDDFRNFRSRKETLTKNAINVFKDNIEDYKLLEEAIERRNVLIHNRGKVNKNYNNRLKTQVPLESKLNVDNVYYYKIDEVIERIVYKIDTEITGKYSN